MLIAKNLTVKISVVKWNRQPDNIFCRPILNEMLMLVEHGTIHTPCLKKNCAKLFLSELCQMSTNFDNFWQKDGKEAKIV